MSRIRGFFDPRLENIPRVRGYYLPCWQTRILRVKFEVWSRQDRRCRPIGRGTRGCLYTDGNTDGTTPPGYGTFVSATGENDGRLGARALLRSGRTPGAVNESVTPDSCTGQREHGVQSAAFRAGRATPLPPAFLDGDVAGDCVPDPAKTDGGDTREKWRRWQPAPGTTPGPSGEPAPMNAFVPLRPLPSPRRLRATARSAAGRASAGGGGRSCEGRGVGGLPADMPPAPCRIHALHTLYRGRLRARSAAGPAAYCEPCPHQNLKMC